MRPRRVCVLVVTAVAGLAWVAGCGDGSTEPAPYFPEPTTVTVTPATTEFTALDATVQLTAEVRDQKGNVMAGAVVTWASSTAAVATVSAAGLVTAAGNGAATINASAGSASGSAAVTVAQSVSAVVVTPAVDTLLAGDTLRLAAEARDTNGHGVAGQDFSWASSDTAVAVVDNAGLVTGIGAGAAEVTATASGITGSAEITVVPPVATIIAVTPETLALTALGQTAQLAPEVRDQAGRVVEGVTVSWSSNDTTVVAVDSAGLATAAGNGMATITAAAGTASGSAAVTVAQSVSAVVVIPAVDTLLAGDTLRLAAEARDTSGHGVAGQDFSWASSDTAVAVVDNAGLVTGIGAGAAEVTATASGITGSAEITVVPPVATTVAVTPETLALTALGQIAQLTAEVRDQNGDEIPQALVAWSSSNVSVASVDGSGLVTAEGNGAATMTAASGERSGTAAVIVAQTIVSLAVEPVRLAAAQAGKQGADTILVTALDGGGSPVTGASYRWSTDRHSGWVYPYGGVTDSRGRLQSTWVAGWPGEGVLSLIVENNSSLVTQEFATLSTTPTNPPNGALGMVFKHGNSASAGYSLDLTPLSEPTGTYYAAIQWDGGYTGLQRGGIRYDRQLQFSVWDAPGFGSAELIEKASDVVCSPFGSEGTGVTCELNYPWRVGSAYRFEITEEEMNGGSATTLHVTDLATESSRFVGTIRFARRSRLDGFAMFVEDFAQRAQHCLAREVRSAAIRRPRALLDGAWIALDEGTLSRWLVDPWNPGTPGCANLAVRDHAAGLELVIGGETTSDPNGSRYYTIPKD